MPHNSPQPTVWECHARAPVTPLGGAEAPFLGRLRAQGGQTMLAFSPHPLIPALGLTHPLARMTPTATMTRAKKQLALIPASTTSKAMRASRLRPRPHSQ